MLARNPSLRRWLSSRCKKLSSLSSSDAISEITSTLEGILGSFLELSKVEESEVDSDEDGSDPSKQVKRQYLVSRFSNEHETCREPSGKDTNSRIRAGSYGNNFAEYFRSKSETLILLN